MTPPATLTSDGVWSYAYDGESRLKTVSGVTYTYDGDGQRVETDWTFAMYHRQAPLNKQLKGTIGYRHRDSPP